MRSSWLSWRYFEGSASVSLRKGAAVKSASKSRCSVLACAQPVIDTSVGSTSCRNEGAWYSAVVLRLVRCTCSRLGKFAEL